MGLDRIQHPRRDDIDSNVSLRAMSLERTRSAPLLALHSVSTSAESDTLLAARERLQLGRCEQHSPKYAAVSSKPLTKDLNRFQEASKNDFHLRTAQLRRPMTRNHYDISARMQLIAHASKPRSNSSLDTVAANSTTYSPTHCDPEA